MQESEHLLAQVNKHTPWTAACHCCDNGSQHGVCRCPVSLGARCSCTSCSEWYQLLRLRHWVWLMLLCTHSLLDRSTREHGQRCSARSGGRKRKTPFILEDRNPVCAVSARELKCSHSSPSRCSLWPCTLPRLNPPPDSSRSAGVRPPPASTPPGRCPPRSGRGQWGTEPVNVKERQRMERNSGTNKPEGGTVVNVLPKLSCSEPPSYASKHRHAGLRQNVCLTLRVLSIKTQLLISLAASTASAGNYESLSQHNLESPFRCSHYSHHLMHTLLRGHQGYIF